jgi:glycosyltransferase involved in cell wall biosynthesis
MRICLVSQEYPPETAKGGIGTQTYMKAHGLAGLGHEIFVLSRVEGYTERREYRTGDVTVIRIPNILRSVHTEIADWVIYSGAVAAELSRLHYRAPLDLVDFPEWAAEGFAHLLNRNQWSYVPAVIQLHGPLVMFAEKMGWPAKDSELYRTGVYMEGACLRLADGIFSSSDCSADWCSEQYGLDRSSIPRLHTGVDVAMFHPFDEPKEARPTVVFVGKLVGNKGIRDLVEAVSRLAGEIPDIQLRLIGRGSEEVVAELQHVAESHSAGGVLDFAGFLPREELPRQLSRAHVFASPSEYEAGPCLALLEAMACGLPVIASAGSGGSEMVTDETGYLVPPNNPEAIAAVLRKLLIMEPETRAAIGARGRRFVAVEAESGKCLRAIEQFYIDVAERVRKRLLR